MSEDEKADRRAIYIPDDVAEAAALPEDLDSDVDDIDYAVPDTNRRRRAGAVYLVGAAGAGLLIARGFLPQPMWWTATAVLVAVGVYHFIAGWNLTVREGPALEVANQTVSFPVGHASASLGFAGWRARPVWNVLVFSADEPPSQRGLVRIDGIDGHVVDSYVEEIPEA
ncbi:MAG: hypothetical protein BMS9Abin07_1013 [Acidimicrobiia bacterium]|nr:MAG: hypothetical protein BMS9Abin07_1013 [Acidimicrobiia bacterium]